MTVHVVFRVFFANIFVSDLFVIKCFECRKCHLLQQHAVRMAWSVAEIRVRVGVGLGLM